MSETPAPVPGNPSPTLVAALRRVLRPLVRLMLAHQITYPFLISLLKSIFVEVAEQEMQVPGKRQSDSRIHLLTGVHRKDVKRLRAETMANPPSVPQTASVGAQIIGRWMGSREFADSAGHPRPLALKQTGSDGVSFDALVEQVCKQDIRPRVILDEWLRLGVAHIEDEHVVLNTGAFTPEKGFDEKVFFFGKNTQDHISAATHNLLGNKPSYFDRSVYYDQLSRNSVDTLADLANTLGMQALTEMNKTALKLQEQDKLDRQDKGANGEKFRMNFGIFNFNDHTDKPQGK